jgi:hypothetical protein
LDPKEKRTEPGRFVSWVGWVKRSGWVGYNRIDYSRRINQMTYIRSRFKASGAIGSKIKGQETWGCTLVGRCACTGSEGPINSYFPSLFSRFHPSFSLHASLFSLSPCFFFNSLSSFSFSNQSLLLFLLLLIYFIIFCFLFSTPTSYCFFDLNGNQKK